MILLERIVAEARLEVYPERCLKLRHRKSDCQLCQDFCPGEAISLGDSPKVDYARCCGCGICANLCPTEAFELGGLSYQHLLAQIQIDESAEAEFGCPRWALEKGGVTVPCLGYLNESVLIGAIARGARAVKLDITQCQKCELSFGFQAARRSARQANRILALFDRPERVVLTAGDQSVTHNQPDNRHFSRREFFSYLSRGTWKTLTQVMESTATGEGRSRAGALLKPRLPKKQHLLLESLKALGEPVTAVVENKDLPFTRIEMTEGCDGCGLCVTFCPTGALKQFDDNGNRAIGFSSAFCLACNLCLKICPRGALTSLAYSNIHDLVTEKRRVLVEIEQQACIRCGQMSTVTSGPSLCPNCQRAKGIKEWLTRPRQPFVRRIAGN